MAYRFALHTIVKIHDFFHVSLLQKYIKDINHVINWFVLQVEQEGEFQPKPLCILYQRKIGLYNQVIEQVKVQWRHFGPEVAT